MSEGSRAAVSPDTDGLRVGGGWGFAACRTAVEKKRTILTNYIGCLLADENAGENQRDSIQKQAYNIVGYGDLASKRPQLLHQDLHGPQSSTQPEMYTKADFNDAKEPRLKTRCRMPLQRSGC